LFFSSFNFSLKFKVTGHERKRFKGERTTTAMMMLFVVVDLL